MASTAHSFDPLDSGSSPLANLDRTRVAHQCVCCGGRDVESSAAILMPFMSDRIFGWKPVMIDESWGLRTIPQGMAYSLCSTRVCRDCDLMFLDIRFSDDEMEALYRDYRGEDYTRLRDEYEPGYAARNARLGEQVEYVGEIEAFVQPHLSTPVTLLDWGGDTGKNTPFRGKATKIDVYDISNMPVIDGINVVSREQALATKYRLIVCSMVLEHVPYPSDILFDIKEVMDDGSILYVEVPFEELMRGEGPVRSTMKRHWHEHVNFFSKEAMRRLIVNCGYEVVDMRVLETTVAGAPVHVLQLACRLARG